MGLTALAAGGCAPGLQPGPTGSGLGAMPGQAARYRLTRDWGPLPPRVPDLRPAPPPIVGTAHAEDPRSPDVARLVRDAVEQAGGFSRIVRPGDRVLIKPNLVTNARSGTGFTTDIRVAEAVARLALDAGARTVVFAEGSASATAGGVTTYRRGATTSAAFAAGGFVALARRLDAELLDLNEAGREPGGRRTSRASCGTRSSRRVVSRGSSGRVTACSSSPTS